MVKEQTRDSKILPYVLMVKEQTRDSKILLQWTFVKPNLAEYNCFLFSHKLFAAYKL